MYSHVYWPNGSWLTRTVCVCSSADLHSPGRGLVAVHHHESSHASTLTEGSHESHDTSLESHGTSVESRDLREPSLEEGGDGGRKEEDWEKQTDAVGGVVEEDKAGQEGEDEGVKEEDGGAKEDREERTDSIEGGEEDEGAEKVEGEEEEAKRIMEFGEVAEKEEEEMEEEEDTVEKEEGNEEEAEREIEVEKKEGDRTVKRGGEESGAEIAEKGETKEEEEREGEEREGEKREEEERGGEERGGKQQEEDTGGVMFLETGGLEEYPYERGNREEIGGVGETVEAAYMTEVPRDEPPPALGCVVVPQPALDAEQGDTMVGGEDEVVGAEREVCGAESISEEPGHTGASQAQLKGGLREDEVSEHPETLEKSGSQGSIQDTIQDIVQDTNLESGQDTGQENSQNNVQDTSRESSEKNVQDTGQESSPDNVQDTGQESVQDNVQDSGQEGSQDNVQDSGQESSQDNDRENIWDTGQESIQDTPQEDVVQDTGQGSIEDTATAQRHSDPEEFDGVGETDTGRIVERNKQGEEVGVAGGEREEEGEKSLELDSVESSDGELLIHIVTFTS